jgi:hypothetical protein
VSTIVFICLVVCGAGVLAAVWVTAYRVGFGEGRLTIPLRMINALAEHEIACLEGHPERAARDLVDQLGLPEIEARRLVTRVETSRAPRAGGLKSA